jgi:hypothetical protein
VRNPVRAAILGSATVIALALGIAGCASSTAVGGARSEPDVEWAVRAVDPCGLLRSAGPGRLTRPHRCAVDQLLPNGRMGLLELDVGTYFDTFDRLEAEPVQVGELSAYQVRLTPVGRDGREEKVCHVHLPISPTRSVRIASVDLGGDLAAGCATARTAATEAAGQMSTLPGAPALARREACDLLAGVARVSTAARNDADFCTGTLGAALDLDRFSVRIHFGALAGLPDDRVVLLQLPSGPMEQRFSPGDDSGGPSCSVTVGLPQDVFGVRPTEAGLLTVHTSGEDDPCRDAEQVAVVLQERVSRPAPAPPLPPVPARLGFPVGVPDDVRPAACAMRNACRVPLPAAAPVGVQAVLDEAASQERSLTAADRTCAILDRATRSVVGRGVELAAVAFGATCIALVPGGPTYGLRFDRERSIDHYCVDGESRPDPDRVRPRAVAGRAGCVWQFGLQAFAAFPDDPHRPGTMLIDLSWEVRGDPGAPVDGARLAETTDRITEYVITEHLR